MRLLTSLALVTFAVAGLAQFTPAQAQATRTWVSGVGDDVNPCSRTAPCKTFAGAISKTATNGEINVIDPGAFGAVTITKSISIVAEGLTAGVLATLNSNGILVNLPAGSDVYLQGLDIEGANTGNNGIRMIGLGKLTVRNTTIRNFVGAGVDVAGGANARVFVDNVQSVGNGFGIRVAGAAGVANTAFIQGSLLDANTTAAVQVTGPSTVIISESTLSGSGGTDLTVLSGGTAISYGNNLIRSGAATQTLSEN